MTNLEDKINEFCYICGFEFSKSKCFKEMRYPFYDCPCCGFEYGIEEFEKNVYTTKRIEWIENPLKFGSPDCIPDSDKWTLDKAITQLQNLKNVVLFRKSERELNPDFNANFDLELVRLKWHEHKQ